MRDIDKKLQTTHNFNCLVGRYYDDGKEKTFQQNLEQEKIEHLKRAYDRIPPAMKFR